MYRHLSFLLVLMLLATGCVTTIEPTAVPVIPNSTAAPINSNPTVAPQAQATAGPASQGQCQSKLLGKVVDAAGVLAKGAVVQIKSGAFNAKTQSDDNGLYGFAGLCAGGYGFTVTLSGKAPKALATTATLDGANTSRTDLTVK